MSQPTCSCEFYERTPGVHDALIGIEDLGPVAAAQVIASLILDDEIGDDAESLYADHDADAFGRFVTQYNWRDPVAMSRLADDVDVAVLRDCQWQRVIAVA